MEDAPSTQCGRCHALAVALIESSLCCAVAQSYAELPRCVTNFSQIFHDSDAVDTRSLFHLGRLLRRTIVCDVLAVAAVLAGGCWGHSSFRAANIRRSNLAATYSVVAQPPLN